MLLLREGLCWLGEREASGMAWWREPGINGWSRTWGLKILAQSLKDLTKTRKGKSYSKDSYASSGSMSLGRLNTRTLGTSSCWGLSWASLKLWYEGHSGWFPRADCLLPFTPLEMDHIALGKCAVKFTIHSFFRSNSLSLPPSSLPILFCFVETHYVIQAFLELAM